MIILCLGIMIIILENLYLKRNQQLEKIIITNLIIVRIKFTNLETIKIPIKNMLQFRIFRNLLIRVGSKGFLIILSQINIDTLLYK